MGGEGISYACAERARGVEGGPRRAAIEIQGLVVEKKKEVSRARRFAIILLKRRQLGYLVAHTLVKPFYITSCPWATSCLYAYHSCHMRSECCTGGGLIVVL